MQLAERAEQARPPYVQTCYSIVNAVNGLGIAPVDRRNTWMADAQEAAQRGSIETARAIYSHSLNTLPMEKSIWMAVLGFERAHGTRACLDKLLRNSKKYCPEVRYLCSSSGPLLH